MNSDHFDRYIRQIWEEGENSLAGLPNKRRIWHKMNGRSSLKRIVVYVTLAAASLVSILLMVRIEDALPIEDCSITQQVSEPVQSEPETVLATLSPVVDKQIKQKKQRNILKVVADTTTALIAAEPIIEQPIIITDMAEEELPAENESESSHLIVVTVTLSPQKKHTARITFPFGNGTENLLPVNEQPLMMRGIVLASKKTN